VSLFYCPTFPTFRKEEEEEEEEEEEACPMGPIATHPVLQIKDVPQERYFSLPGTPVDSLHISVVPSLNLVCASHIIMDSVCQPYYNG
jgi:hypothetical protein